MYQIIETTAKGIMKTKFCQLFIGLAVFASITSIHASVAFTNLAFFTYTNLPDYGWNSYTPNGRTSMLVEGNDGNFYGTTYGGGDTVGYDGGGDGTVFKMTPGGAFTSLYSFDTIVFEQDGRGPLGNLIKGADGNLYGTTEYGGNIPDTDNGTIFQITTNGALTTLYSFGSNGVTSNTFWPDGRFPFAGVTQDSDGNFYGTTTTSGAGEQGTIYQLTSGGTLNVLHSFPDDTNAAFSVDGGMPASELTEGPDGNFYGTTYWGGTNYNGTIFRITTNGTFTALYSFSSTAGGTYAPLLLGKDGNFYGTAQGIGGSGNGSGIIFQFTTNAVFTVLHTFFFDGTPSGLMQGSDGNFYGTTSQGGSFDLPSGGGTIFQMTTNGTVTTLYSFSGPDGQEPQGALVEGTDGNLYGTTSYGGPQWNAETGAPGYGTIFRITVPPAFQSIAQTNGVVSLTWSAMSNQTCQVQYSTNLVSTNWINLSSAVTVTNSPVSVHDATATDSQRFYRIMLTQ
jgi:uncharacterized repeat protein (TIGR03803 family)